MSSEHYLIKALYDYDAVDPKVLNCRTDERFVIIKQSTEWLYVVNTNGRLGYIPANYIQRETIGDEEFLVLIDSIIGLLDAQHNDSNAITTRQINHAQVKLTQLRCEIVQRILPAKTSSPPAVDGDANPAADTGESDIQTQEVATQTDRVIEAEGGDNQQKATMVKNPSDVPSDLVATLVERLRVNAELSHHMCKLSAETVIKCMKEMVPSMENQCAQILEQLKDDNLKCPSPDVMLHSSDLIKLKSLFRKLWFCKNDEQQRSWPVHEDEELIGNYLNEIIKLVINANPSITREVICQHSYDNVHMLVAYFQMETRKDLKMKLYCILLEIIRLAEEVIPEYMLTSVLPSALADEMLNHSDDVERFTKAALLFTAVFTTGSKPPINIYEHINANFIGKLLTIIEGEDISGNKAENRIPPETSIPPILSFNLHFDEKEHNLVLKALRKMEHASQFTEILVSHLNWEEDPSRLSSIVGNTESQLGTDRPNAVHKLLIEIFDDPSVAKLFYYNDVRVLVDIIVTHLNNLLPGDKSRESYLTLALNIVENTAYKEEPHKLPEVLECLSYIENHENSSVQEKNLTQKIKNLLPSL